LIDFIISRPALGIRNSQWFCESENNHLNLVLLGFGGLSQELETAIKVSSKIR